MRESFRKISTIPVTWLYVALTKKIREREREGKRGKKEREREKRIDRGFFSGFSLGSFSFLPLFLFVSLFLSRARHFIIVEINARINTYPRLYEFIPVGIPLFSLLLYSFLFSFLRYTVIVVSFSRCHLRCDKRCQCVVVSTGGEGGGRKSANVFTFVTARRERK